jgi:hypothetical protein
MTLIAGRRLVPGLPLLVLSLWVLGCALARIPQDLEYTRLATEVGFWGRNDYFPPRDSRRATAAAAHELLNRRPDHPAVLALVARISGWEGYYSLTPGNARHHFAAAVEQQRRALVARPASLEGWRLMQDYAAGAGDEIARTQAERRAAELRGGRN